MPAELLEPDWGAPLDVDAYVGAVPPGASAKGMFSAAILETAKSRGLPLPAARERYLSFEDVPMREYILLLVQAARVFFPDTTLRQGLRKLGRATRDVFERSIVGAVFMSTGDDLPGAIAAAAKAYAIMTPPSRFEILESTPKRIVVSLTSVYNFLDCHHVGVLEGLARGHGIQVAARVRLHSMFDGEIELTW